MNKTKFNLLKAQYFENVYIKLYAGYDVDIKKKLNALTTKERSRKIV